jgi:beta-glucanase (GH16 family)
MKMCLLLLLVTATLMCCNKKKDHPSPSPAPIGWQLVWSDEFNGSGLPDMNKWSYDVGGHGWGNNELQHYTRNRTENARMENGNLVIEAHKENLDTNKYTSARLVTKGKGDWKYGKIEVRAQLPQGRGTWPAIWMLGSREPLRWPLDGEIDIMEHVGFNPGNIHASVHTQKYNHINGTQKTAVTTVADFNTNFHVYMMEWNADSVKVSADGNVYFRFANERSGQDAWPFDAPFHLLLNIAVGGNWGGQQGVDDTTFPQRMLVDYVRVYARN